VTWKCETFRASIGCQAGKQPGPQAILFRNGFSRNSNYFTSHLAIFAAAASHQMYMNAVRATSLKRTECQLCQLALRVDCQFGNRS
jgi:hypothetical protein